MTLPSGKLRWQRSACLSWPTIEEQQAIKAMQQGMDVTTVETLAVRMHLLQRWVDLLILEGVPFLHEMSVWLPSADEYDRGRHAMRSIRRSEKVDFPMLVLSSIGFLRN